MKQKRKMRSRDKIIILFCLLVGLAGAGFLLYLQSQVQHYLER